MYIKVDTREIYERLLGHKSKFSDEGLAILLFHKDTDTGEELTIYGNNFFSFEERWEEYKNIREMARAIFKDEKLLSELDVRSDSYILTHLFETGEEFLYRTEEGVFLRCLHNIDNL